MITGSVPADDAPKCLWRLGLLEESPSDPHKLVPVAVDLAFAQLARPLEEAIAKNRSMVNWLAKIFDPVQAAYTEAKRAQQIWVTELSGQSLIRSALEHAVSSCTQELITVQPGGGRDPELLRDALRRDLAMLRRGVQQRTLYQHSARFHAPTRSYVEEIIKANGQVRTLDEISERMIICDREVAFIPGTEDRATSALEIRHPAIVDFLLKSFERAWEQAAPVNAKDNMKDQRIVDETQQAILRLLVAGHTDETIARRLGKSRRSVAGYISKISAELGSHSRAQLGYFIATSGLLGADRT
ncbi:LuxR C-terminal-related transcriptional regulator [Saccharopolyspora sp. NPDC050389]|uniref:LuxR C-terminal-related transcriptional regulator n=1 Tax=Saccharopolyspora sp. NPDC050389 TaxID=3155516 RepID=UPI0033F75578